MSERSDNELHMSIAADWDEMVTVNEKAYAFLESLDLPEDTVDTLTMVICELTENAIKYGIRPGTENDEIEVVASIENGVLLVHVVNRVSTETRHHLRQLDRTLQWTRGFQDPFQAYILRVKEISRELASSNMSGLGIVRIAYEARATIDFIVGEDDTLSVSAVAEIR